VPGAGLISIRRRTLVESDEEQLELIKKWWEENGTSLVTAIVLALGVTFGYRAWEDNVRETAEAASAKYENLVQAASVAADENMRATAETLGAELKQEHADSTYSVFAAMHLAKIAVEEGDLDKAQAELEWARNQKPDMNVDTLVRMRLARVMVAKDDPTAALAQIQNYDPAPGQVSAWEEVRGDIFVALGDKANARASYQRALENLVDDQSRPILELKLADIPLQGGAATAADVEGDA